MKRVVLFVVAVSISVAMQVHATDGINLIGLGPVQKGTAGAGVASAKDSTWLLLNPAGLTQVRRGVDASIEVFAPVRSMDSTMSGGAGKQRDDSAFLVPSISASFGCCNGESGFWGFGLYGTSGMGTDYDDGRFGADSNGDFMPDMPQSMGDKRAELSIAKMTTVYALRLGDGWSIGAGPIMVISRLRTDMFNGRSFESGNWDTALGGGAIFGVTKEFEKFSLGASYMSQQYMQSFDEYDDIMPDSFDLPQQATAGIAIDVLDDLELALDYEWINWSGVKELGDHFGWDDQHVVKAGLTWDASELLTLRCGVSHANSPIDSSTAFSNSLFPAIMQTHATCGASYVLDNWIFHVAYVHAFEETVTANGADMIPSTGAPVGRDSEISMYQNTLSIGASYKF